MASAKTAVASRNMIRQVKSIANLLLSINGHLTDAGNVRGMKTKGFAQRRRRIRSMFGWTLILAVASVELWMAGQVAQGFGKSMHQSAWQFQGAFFPAEIR
jgi:hypothetical protein